MKARLWIGTALLAALVPGSVLGDEFYRHLDENGSITYSDRPGSASEAPLNIGLPNVTAPEAAQELYREMQRVRFEEALQDKYQQDSINAAEEATQAIMRERNGERAVRRQLRGWCHEGDPSRGGPGCPSN